MSNTQEDIVDLSQIFDEALDKKNAERFKQDPNKPAYVPKPNMKPSTFSSKCLRKIYYSYNRVEVDFPFPQAQKRIMALGDAFHDVLKDTFRYAGILIDYYKPGQDPTKLTNSEREFTMSHPDLDMKNAKMDALFKLKSKHWISEFKSINLRQFETLQDPKEDHQEQANSYVYFFNQELASGKYAHIKELEGVTEVVGVVYIYVCKDDGRFRQFYVSPNPDKFSITVEKIVTVLDHSKAGTLPPKTNDWCQSCSWRLKCQKDLKI